MQPLTQARTAAVAEAIEAYSTKLNPRLWLVARLEKSPEESNKREQSTPKKNNRPANLYPEQGGHLEQVRDTTLHSEWFLHL